MKKALLLLGLAVTCFGQAVSQLNIFSPTSPISPSVYYTPGNGSPAVSTADYYHLDGLYWFRPYDLLTMGTPGAAIAAAHGRYFWIATPDHPSSNYGWVDGWDFMGGYSSDPGVLPATLNLLFRWNNDILVGGTQHFGLYQAPWLVYNPDDVANPFYLYAEGATTSGSPSLQHEEGFAKSADLSTWMMGGPSHLTTTFAQWSSFQRVYRTGVNTWNSTGLQVGFTPNAFGTGAWTATSGAGPFTSGTTLINACDPANSGTPGALPCDHMTNSTMSFGSADNVTFGGQLYSVVAEDARNNTGGGMYVSMVPIDGSGNVLSSPATIRISAKYDGVYPGPGYLQNVGSYLEDGVLSIYASHGFPPSSANQGLVNGATYANGGGLWEQFIDRYTKIIDAAAAADAAPIGVTASAASGTVTLTWDDALPNNTYRVKRGSDGVTFGTTVGDVAAVTITDTPGTGTWYYKVITLHSGVEKQSRIVRVYASGSPGLVNDHINRVLTDGADAATIDASWLSAATNWLAANGLTKDLLFWSDPAFGVKKSGSVIQKIYDLGTTRLPRGGDLIPSTGTTTYNATGVNGFPAWVNANTNSFGYFGNGRLNNIRRKIQITEVANYQKSGTGLVSLLGFDYISEIALQNTSGSPGNASFSLTGLVSPGTPVTATAGAVTNNAPHIIGGTFDGTNVTAYTDGVAGTPQSGVPGNTDLALNTELKGGLGTAYMGAPPFLCSGSDQCTATANGVKTFGSNQAQFSASDLIIFDKALTSMQMASLTTLLQTHTYSAPGVYNIVTDFGATCDGNPAHNDNSAFAAFNTAALALQMSTPGLIELDIPQGGTCMFVSGGSGSRFAQGINQLLVKGLGTGATLSDNAGAGNGFFLGGIGEIEDNAHSSRTASVASGATSVTLLTPAEASRFVVGRYALMTGLDLQGFGFPSNPYYFDHVKITASSTMTGVVAFDRVLTNNYLSTWPLYNAGDGSHVDQGGPATLYALDPTWDTEVEYRKLTIDQAGQTYANGRSITYTDVAWTGTACSIPTQNLVWTVTNGLMTNCNIEVDKIIGTMTLNSVTAHQILFQSSSINQFNCTACTVTSTLNGSAKHNTFSTSTFANFSPGSYALGVTSFVTCSTCVLTAVVPLGFTEALVANGYTMSGGMIQVANGHGPVTWAVPGFTTIFGGTYPQESTFTITGITQDGTNTYIQTSLAGGFPTIPGTLGARTVPVPHFTCTACTGSADAVDLSGAAPGRSLWSYSNRSNTGNTANAIIPVWGRLGSIRINVTRAYTGAQGTINFNLDGPFIINNAGSAVTWSPTINPKIVGERIILPASVSGTQSGDSVSAPGAGTWLLSNQLTPKLSVAISGEDPALWPIITVEFVADQSVPNPAMVVSGMKMSNMVIQ